MRVGDREVHFRVAGEGPTIVLCHSIPGSSAQLATLMDALAHDACVIAVDAPGFGSSSPLETACPEIASYAAALAETLETLGINSALIYGQQFGASVALQLALDHPECVTALILVSSPRPMLEDLAAALPSPHLDGSHLLAAWTYTRDSHLFLVEGSRNPSDLPTAEQLHAEVMDLLRAGPAQLTALRAHLNFDAPRARSLVATPIHDVPQNAAPDCLRTLASNLVVLRSPERPVSKNLSVGTLTHDYVDTEFGQVLIRRIEHSGDGTLPLVMLHASPGSGAQLVDLMHNFARSRTVIALDTLGHGESDPAPWPAPHIEDYALPVVEVIGKLLEDRAVELYGTHTGAFVAVETAILLKEQVARIVLDGVGIWNEVERNDLIANYAPDFVPRHDGTHLVQLWAQMRDMTLFWPWYNRTASGVISVPPITALALHEWALEAFKSGVNYPRAYQAAFRYLARDRLPLLSRPVLLCDDPQDVLASSVATALRLLPAGRIAKVSADSRTRSSRIAEFLDYGR